ncbi:MAG: response regulator [Chloroflexota bacterium]|nr:response regulator [Chloroflexota bacterium]
MGGDERLRPRVLVVDDDDAIAELVREILGPEGYAVATAPNGADALELVRLHDPVLILVDLRMPVMDGRSFIDQYRRRGGHARIFVFSAAGGAADALPMAGVDGAIAKPFDVDALLGAVAWATGGVPRVRPPAETA